MKKEKRLRRRVEKPEELEEMDDNNMSPVRCVDCGKQYPLVSGTSTIRCKPCNTVYKKKVDFHYVGFSK